MKRSDKANAHEYNLLEKPLETRASTSFLPSALVSFSCLNKLTRTK